MPGPGPRGGQGIDGPGAGQAGRPGERRSLGQELPAADRVLAAVRHGVITFSQS
jgi:hypothetical protein